jgi:hypothetical protein
MEIDIIDKLVTLSTERSVEIHEGIFLKCSDRINIQIYPENGDVVIDLGSPNVYIVAKKLGGGMIITKWMKPVVDKIVITDKVYRIEAKPFGHVEIDRKKS